MMGKIVRISEKTARDVKILAAQQGTSMADLMEKAWELFRNPIQQQNVAIDTNEVYTLEIRRFISMLVRVLKSDNERAKLAVRTNLEWMYEQVGGTPEDVEPIAVVEIDGSTIERLLQQKTGTSGGAVAPPSGGHALIRGGKGNPNRKR